jgi:hypothetical protein
MIDLSPAEVDRRLREASRLAVLTPPFPPAIDMSAGSVALRLREAAQLFGLERRLRGREPADGT